MTAGRKPLPTRIKKLRGTFQKCRSSLNEPDPKVCLPAPPDHLSDAAKTEWERMGKKLEAMGLLTEIDDSMFSLYCETWATWLDAKKHVIEEGATVESPNGYKMPSPFVAIARNSITQLTALLREFGMSPSSRSKVSVVDMRPKEENPFLKLMSNRKSHE